MRDILTEYGQGGSRSSKVLDVDWHVEAAEWPEKPGHSEPTR